LRGFLQSAKQRGIPDETLVSLLRHRGFSERSIYRALAAHYEDVLGESLPSRGLDVENARDAFYYLLNFITLAFWTVALGQIFYMLIERRFPDALDANVPSSVRDEIAGQLAAVIVTFPVFSIVHSLIQAQLRKRPDLYYSPIRRWLTYVALVLAAIVLVADAVWFVTSFLQGQLSIRFALDSLVLLVLGGGVFLYYLMTMEPPAARA
jgi:small-conductance mechanosensitive channel